MRQICDKIYNSCYQIIQKSPHPQNSTFYNIAQELKNNQLFKISKVDKGYNWVITSRKLYDKECIRQLNNEEFYGRINEEKNVNNKNSINRSVAYLLQNKLLHKKEASSIKVNNYSKRNFYVLPKVHKVHWSTANYMPPGRPIINCAN